MERILIDMDFDLRTDDEPEYRCWVLENPVRGTDLMVETDDVGWSLHRGPVGNEPAGVWVQVDAGLDQDALIARLKAMLGEPAAASQAIAEERKGTPCSR